MLPRPARALQPEAFCCVYLPGLWAELTGTGSFGPWPEGELRVAVRIDDVACALVARGGTVTGSTGLPAAPLLGVHMDRAAYQVLIRDLAPRVLARADARRAIIQATLERASRVWGGHHLDAVRARPGTVQVHYVDDAGDAVRAEVCLGDGQGPSAAVHLDDAAVAKLLSAADAHALPRLLATQVRITGDAAYLMALLPKG